MANTSSSSDFQLPITPVGEREQSAAPKYAVEYPLPAADFTHELTVLGDRMVVISQQSNSVLVKVALNDAGVPVKARGFRIGNGRSGLHGVTASTTHPGMVWITLQYQNALVLLDPVADDVDAAPVVQKYISVPAPGRGPHVIIEQGTELWTTLKDSHHVLQIDQNEPRTYHLYPVSRTPVFVAKHGGSGDYYASIDIASKIARLNPRTQEVTEYDIPTDRGSTAVGLIAGPDENVWFVLLGDAAGGSGTFGKILQDGTVEYIRLPNPQGSTAGLLHLAFHPKGDNAPRLYLLSSSIADAAGVNAVFDVSLNDEYSRIETIATTTLPTQYSKAHRVFYTKNGLYVTELSVSLLCHIRTDFANNTPVVDETSDYYAGFGAGTFEEKVRYLDVSSVNVYRER